MDFDDLQKLREEVATVADMVQECLIKIEVLKIKLESLLNLVC